MDYRIEDDTERAYPCEDCGDAWHPDHRCYERPERKMGEVVEPRRQQPGHGISEFFGTWPGDETDAELLALLDD